ncbi:MAG TPA: FTR1 family protein [Nitrososphaeraceae archaeon]|nr:FTR1 family protein [Nitrososphaeraceae archaeon]
MRASSFSIFLIFVGSLIVTVIVQPPLLDFSSDSTRGAFALKEDIAQSLIIFTNLQRIGTQINLTQYSLNSDDLNDAFQHAFIPHSVTFPVLKPILNEIDPASSKKLEALLIDLPIKVRTAQSSEEAYSIIKADITDIDNLLNMISNSTIGQQTLFEDKGFVLQASAVLLEDAIQSYGLFNTTTPIQDDSDIFDRQNALGMINSSMLNFERIADSVDDRRRDEIRSFYDQLQERIKMTAPFDTVASIASAIERDFSEELTLSSGSESGAEQLQYFSTIRDLLNTVIDSVNNGNYEAADAAAIKAYLDNYEYLEAPIEKHDPDLMSDIEIEMREELRRMIQEEHSPQEVHTFVSVILSKLNQAEELLRNDPEFLSASSNTNVTGPVTAGSSLANIEGLRQGFGTYTGETRQMGEADDPAKESVRNNIDQIRLRLSEMQRLYQNKNYEGALIIARSAYLDSYEMIEIPLRPIDPDFTLDTEIKFAELRNLIQEQVPIEEVEAKTIEIRRALDESERLVSGVGIVAPAIAFSTSFSIIFREGLESALIIGAILTYLQASRNTHFKKHVYYGILFAVAATAATWFVAQYLIEISGADRALIEAIAGLSAVAVLFWVSFWVLNKIETKKWIEFVKAKVWKATTTGSVIVFTVLAFFTVYREGFETVLFYQAMLSFATYMELYVAAGLIVGLAVIVSVAILINRLGRRLPLRALFALTMAIGAYMSIAFMGNAVRELQEIGVVPTTPLFGIVPRLDINLATMTGIHPTLESVAAQTILLSVYLVGSLYILVIKPRRQKAIESARKSMADLHDDPGKGR